MERTPATVRKNALFPLLGSACLLVAILYFGQDVLIPIALSILLCFLLAPLVTRLERWHVPRVVAVTLVVLLGCAGVSGLGYVVAQQVLDLANDLPQYKHNIRDKLRAISGTGSGTIEQVTKNVREIQEMSEPTTQSAGDASFTTTRPAAPLAQQQVSPENPFPVRLIPEEVSGFRQFSDYSGPILGRLGIAGIVIVFVFFMLLAREDLRDRMIRLVGYGKLTVTTQAMDEVGQRISRYLTAQAIVNGTYGIAISLGLWVIGLTVGGGVTFPNLVLWGILCAVLRFIPYIGPWLAAVFPIAVSFAVFPGFGVFAAVLGMFVFIELLSNNLMEPWLYGSSTGMSTLAVLVAAVFWTWLWGPMGLLLATPLTVCLVVTGKYVPQLAFLELLLGDQPALTPGQHVYQRLLSGDQEEAVSTTLEYLDEMSLEEVYDKVLIPALAIAEQDGHSGTLEADQRQFVRRSIREMLDDLLDKYEGKLKKAKAKADKAEKANGRVEENSEKTGRIPQGSKINVLTLPARDEADELVGLMLGQLLNLRGYSVITMSVSALASEMMEAVRQEKSDVVVISALPPAATLHARYLCKRLAPVMGKRNTVIGLWTSRADPVRAKERIDSTETVEICTSLQFAIEKVHELAASKIYASAGESAGAGGTTPALATV